MTEPRIYLRSIHLERFGHFHDTVVGPFGDRMNIVLGANEAGKTTVASFVGGVLSPERRFFPKYDKGLYEKGGTKLYVSGGIGKPRLFNPPEINMIYLNSVQK